MNNEKDYLKHTSKPTILFLFYFLFLFLQKSLVNYAAFHEIKPVLTLNKTNLCWIYCSRIK